MKVRKFFSAVSEQILNSVSWLHFSGIRSSFRLIGQNFWPKTHPAAEGTVVNYELCRQLYRNSGENGLGGGFVKPIVDLQVGFIGIPVVTVGDETLDEFLNECISVYWADEIQQMFRDAIRDSKVIALLRKYDVFDPLMTFEESQHLALELLPPERVTIERNLQNRNVIEKATILHRLTVVVSEGDPLTGLDPVEEEHEVLEIIDKERYRFFDRTKDEWLSDLESPNSWKFVPALEVTNEWDSSLQGGQSDLETVIPFINAFHDVLAQGLQAHRYHSTPKVKLKISDLSLFIKNNFPEAWDIETGTVKQGATISWKGREIIFLTDTDDMAFLEAKSVLGDTKELAEFLIDCICIASQTPEWAFMRVDAGSANSDRNAQTVPFVQKISRKRISFQKHVQTLCKMALVAYGEVPERPKVIWGTIRPDDELVLAQAFQQLLMGLEVALQSGEISDQTYRETIRNFLPLMQGGPAERQAAMSNVKKMLDQQQQQQLPPGNAPRGSSSVPIQAGPQGKNE